MRWSIIPCAAGVVALAGAGAQAQVVRSSAGDLAVTTVARGLDHPWAIAFLPEGRLLVTERSGRMRIVGTDGKASSPLAGVPKVFAAGQGGLHDVVLDRGYAENRTIYFCYAEPSDAGARTALARARLLDDATPNSSPQARLDEVKVIFHQEGPLSSGNHFGCRIVQTPDSNLFLSMGDHFGPRDQAQNLANHLGKLIRIKPDGSVPPDNPFVGKAAALASEASGQRGKSIESRAPDTRPEPGSSARALAKPEIWSYGHRNSQGLALHPTTGKLWEHEHGPRGGDEVNVVEKGRNYGWPVIGFGIDYSGARIHESTQKAGMEQPVWYWVPSIAPSGMAFYTGNLLPAWRGNLFVGALAGQLLVRLELDGEKVLKEERLDLRERIRDVRQGPDGAIWLATDSSSGRILRLAPK